MSKRIKLSESELHKIVKEAAKRVIKEAKDGGWYVDDFKASEAYEFALQNGFEQDVLNEAIVRYLSGSATGILAKALAYIFRQYDFRAWADREEDEATYESFKRTRRYSSLLREGNQWIGTYSTDDFHNLLRNANANGGNCSFNLCGCDFTMTRTPRGYTVTSGTNQVTDALYLRSACIAAYDYANKQGDFNPRRRASAASF